MLQHGGDTGLQPQRVHVRAAPPSPPFCNTLRMYWYNGAGQCKQCGRCGNKAEGSSPAQACGNDYDESGHGTHVAATLAGTSDRQTAPDSVRNNGMAGAWGAPTQASAGAKLFLQDVMNGASGAECSALGLEATCGGSMSVPTALENLFADPYLLGVRVHCNSWGCSAGGGGGGGGGGGAGACSSYNSQAQDIDAFNTVSRPPPCTSCKQNPQPQTKPPTIPATPQTPNPLQRTA